MQESAVTKLLNNLLVLRGYIREANIKILALEKVIQDLGGPHYGRYRQLVRESESDSTIAYPLEDIEGLRRALLQGH
jgi:hypothetical protein